MPPHQGSSSDQPRDGQAEQAGQWCPQDAEPQTILVPIPFLALSIGCRWISKSSALMAAQLLL